MTKKLDIKNDLDLSLLRIDEDGNILVDSFGENFVINNSRVSIDTLLEVPRLTQDEINELSGVNAGAIVYNKSINEFSMFTGASWMNFVTTEGPASKISTLGWSQDVDTYSSNDAGPTPIHESMKRCILNLNGTVNYYLDPNDSTLREDGVTPANLDGSDGYVMVEIPKFYFKYERNGDDIEWQIANGPKSGYQLHPAFIKNGVEVDYRYMGAYDACVYDDSSDSYISGLNLDDNSSNVDTSVDKLASVSGIYPMVGLKRNEFRQLAANNGTGWRQQDFWLSSAVQLLYLVEYGTFNSQSVLGDGNTNGGYSNSSSDQNDSPHTVAGASNSWGNFSTDGTQPSAGSKPGTAFMSYRGIENFFGNCWNWVDGFNILDHVGYVTNDDSNFVDDTSDGMQLLGYLSTSTGWATDIIDYPGSFVTSEVGGSSSTFLTDYYFENSGNRVALLGGDASVGSRAGVFYWFVVASSGGANRLVGSRVCY